MSASSRIIRTRSGTLPVLQSHRNAQSASMLAIVVIASEKNVLATFYERVFIDRDSFSGDLADCELHFALFHLSDVIFIFSQRE